MDIESDDISTFTYVYDNLDDYVNELVVKEMMCINFISINIGYNYRIISYISVSKPEVFTTEVILYKFQDN